MAKTIEIPEEYLKHLIELSDELETKAEDFFEVGDGEARVSSQRSNAEVDMLGTIKHLVGYVDAVRDFIGEEK